MFSTKRRIWFFAPIAACAVLLTVGAVMLVGRMTPLLAAERAFADLGGDMNRRIEGSPFGAIPRLMDALEDGVISISYDFSDRWSSNFFDIEFHSDEANREYKLLITFDMAGTEFDLRLHLNRYRIAASGGVLGENYFGLTFETFREDFAPLAGILGLGEEQIDEIANIVEMIGDFMNAPEVGMEVFEPYTALLRQFLLDGTVSSESTTIVTGGQEVSVTRAEFRFTDDDMISLLRDFLTTISEDQYMDPFGMWDEMMPEFEILAGEMDYVDGDMYVIMYIGPENRLVQLEVEVNMTGYGTVTHLFFDADFGTSVFDPWYFTFIVYTEVPSWHDASLVNSNLFEFGYVWTFEETAGRFINTLEVAANFEDSWWHWDGEFIVWEAQISSRLVSDWNSSTGAFVLSFEGEEFGGLFEVTGTYLPDSNGGFLFSLTPIETEFETFSLEVSAQIGSNIQPIEDFINFTEIPLSVLLNLPF